MKFTEATDALRLGDILSSCERNTYVFRVQGRRAVARRSPTHRTDESLTDTGICIEVLCGREQPETQLAEYPSRVVCQTTFPGNSDNHRAPGITQPLHASTRQFLPDALPLQRPHYGSGAQ